MSNQFEKAVSEYLGKPVSRENNVSAEDFIFAWHCSFHLHETVENMAATLKEKYSGKEVGSAAIVGRMKRFHKAKIACQLSVLPRAEGGGSRGAKPLAQCATVHNAYLSALPTPEELQEACDSAPVAGEEGSEE